MSEQRPSVDAILKRLTGKDRRTVISEGRCMNCDERADSFKDDISRREYSLSGFCQVCQDEFFGEDMV